MSFDPFALETITEPKEPKYSASLVARAKKRIVHVIDHNYWSVSGITGEMHQSYKVWRNQGEVKYECECYQTNHGDTRRRKMCSHVLAVVLTKSVNTHTQRKEESPLKLDSVVETVGEGDDGQHSVAGVQSVTPNPPAVINPKCEVVVDSCSGVPDVDDPMWGSQPLPEWMQEIRGHQWDAVQEIVEAFGNGVFNVWLDAPTGAGKTGIGELVRRLLKAKAIYTCSGKTLQDQMVKDYPYAKVLKGKGNYPTELMPEPYNCGDCTGPGCAWCDEMSSCPYQLAKQKAKASPIAVLNTSYLLAEGNYVGEVVRNTPLTILDECDVLEGELMGFVEFSIGDRMLRDLKVTAPKKGSHKATIQEWMNDDLSNAIRVAMRPDNRLFNTGDQLEVMRKKARLQQLAQKAKMVAGQIHEDEWIRDNDAGPLVMKPVKVSAYGEQYLWRHSQRWLSMSATIISPDELCDSLGLDIGRTSTVRVPMTFPLENRRIIVAPVANMVAKEKDTAWPAMAKAIRRVMERHPSERILVHTVSYQLSNYLFDALRDTGRVITYSQSADRDGALQRYRNTPSAVLLASSLDRGVDLRDDDCRVVVVAKMPFPYLGDKQVSARMHMPNGSAWYSVQSIRTLVQMCGRGVRSKTDHCMTYILDRQFVSNLYKRNRNLFPQWWRDALIMDFPTRELTK